MSAKAFKLGLFRIVYWSWAEIRFQFYLLTRRIDFVFSLNKAPHLKKFYIEIEKI
jgi:hypothetical protein